MLFNALSLFSVLPLATAHFVLDWPTARGFEDTTAGNFPCGGFDSVKTPRTEFPLSGGPVQLTMHHTQTNLEVYLALGNDPGSNYNIVLRPLLSMNGLGQFCMGMISIPSKLNITAGTNATIQVVSNGDPDGGLYQCADVTFTNTALSTSDYNSHCANGTGVKVTAENQQGNPNGTTSQTSPSSTASGAAASASHGAGAHVTAGSWFLGGVGMAVFALL